MNRIIGVTELQRRFRSVFDEVAEKRTSYVLTRGSRPEAALVSYDEFVRYQELNEKNVIDRFDGMVKKLKQLNVGFSDEDVAKDVELAVREVRQRKGRKNRISKQ